MQKIPAWVMGFGLVMSVLRSISAMAEPFVFEGRIERTFQQSVADWPEPVVAPENAPNVLIWLIDDAGFAHLDTHGGLIATPTINSLAENGLRYTNFHTTALCSSSRAALLTGQNHHSIGMGSHSVTAMGFPGYHGRVPKSAATMAKILQQRGYTTIAVGKWDHTPPGDTTLAGPFDRWPSGQGFDHFYGFMSADAHHFSPLLWANHYPIEPARNNPDYHLSTDMADQAISYITGIKSAQPDRPFFMYWASGAVHAPHHAPKPWIEKYRGKFDMGWDKLRQQIFARQQSLDIVPKGTALTQRLEGIASWETLSADARRLYARQMEAFAGQLSHADYEFGRIIKMLERIGQLDNTLIIVTSDNGASAEGGPHGTYNEARFYNGQETTVAHNAKHYDGWGGPDSYPHFAAGWAMAGNTPFKWFKQTAHRGGQHAPLVISWPNGIKSNGEIRRQYHHLIDLAPTVLAAANVQPPQSVDGVVQMPIAGIAMNYSFDNANAEDRRTSQYYEMFGNRAIYADGWKVVARHKGRMPWSNRGSRAPFDQDDWELYHVAEDFSEAHNLAASHPKKLAEMKQLLDKTFFDYNVYPLSDDLLGRSSEVFRRFSPQGNYFVFYPTGAYRIHEAASPMTKNRSYRIDAEMVMPAQGAEGIIVATGGITSGYALYIKDNHLVYDYNYIGETLYRITSKTALPSGKINVAYTFTKTGLFSGQGALYINGRQVGETTLAKTVPGIFSIDETFDVGLDGGTAVSDGYTTPFTFTGQLNKVEIRLQ